MYRWIDMWPSQRLIFGEFLILLRFLFGRLLSLGFSCVQLIHVPNNLNSNVKIFIPKSKNHLLFSKCLIASLLGVMSVYHQQCYQKFGISLAIITHWSGEEYVLRNAKKDYLEIYYINHMKMTAAITEQIKYETNVCSSQQTKRQKKKSQRLATTINDCMLYDLPAKQ